MLELTIDDKINLLERKLADQQELLIKISKYYNYKLIGKYFLPRLIKEKSVLQDVFRELREVTRKAYPDRFIDSGGNDVSKNS
tara:strand:+ start:651 stop:899 length:249 start_codon:yes stop_codon:yes gene_type:complete